MHAHAYKLTCDKHSVKFNASHKKDGISLSLLYPGITSSIKIVIDECIVAALHESFLEKKPSQVLD